MMTFNDYIIESNKTYVAKNYFERLCKKYKLKVVHYSEQEDYFEFKFTDGCFIFYANYMEKELNKFTIEGKEFFTNKIEKLEEIRTTLANAETIIKEFEKHIKK